MHKQHHQGDSAMTDFLGDVNYQQVLVAFISIRFHHFHEFGHALVADVQTQRLAATGGAQSHGVTRAEPFGTVVIPLIGAFTVSCLAMRRPPLRLQWLGELERFGVQNSSLRQRVNGERDLVLAGEFIVALVWTSSGDPVYD